jgi:hypothetical protein
LKSLPDLVQRLATAQDEVAIELVRRGAFELRHLEQLHNVLGKRSAGGGAPRDGLRNGVRSFLFGNPLAPRAGFIAALAHGDRQLTIHAVINGNLTGDELNRLKKLLDLQRDGHLLRQARVALELEIERRKRGIHSGGNSL